MTIKRYLAENNMTLTELAIKTNLSISLLSKIKDGRCKISKNTKEKLKNTLNVEITEHLSKEMQLEKNVEDLLKEVYKLSNEISTLKNILMQKDLTISFLAHQLKILNKYSNPKANKKDLYKNYKTLLDKYNKLCYNIDTKEEENNESD